MKILVVDDSPILTKNICEYLEHSGNLCTSAQDGEEAMELLLENRYDCIVLDRMMPNLDGMGLLRLMKSRKIDTPVIFLTAL